MRNLRPARNLWTQATNRPLGLISEATTANIPARFVPSEAGKCELGLTSEEKER